jgi:hypothetical protein
MCVCVRERLLTWLAFWDLNFCITKGFCFCFLSWYCCNTRLISYESLISSRIIDQEQNHPLLMNTFMYGVCSHTVQWVIRHAGDRSNIELPSVQKASGFARGVTTCGNRAAERVEYCTYSVGVFLGPPVKRVYLAVRLQTCTRGVPDSKLSRVTGYPDWSFHPLKAVLRSYSVTSLSKILEKLTVAQQVSKFHALYRTRKFTRVRHVTLPWAICI